MFKILSLDGGGLRSVFQARMIQRIEKATQRQLKPNLYAGTSGGAIVATGVQVLPLDQVIEFFKTEGPKIFKKDGLLDDIEDLWNLTGARYQSKGLKSALTKAFGDMKLKELPANTLLTSFSLKNSEGYWQPVVHHNFKGSPKASPELSIVSAVMRSAAAPTYFPIVNEDGEKFCDGGVWGNNPSMAALAAAVDKYVGGQRHDRVSILSIGTGRLKLQLPGSKQDLGALDWLKKGLVDVLLDGNIEAAHYYSRSVLGPAYYRLQVDLADDIRLDDVSGIGRMIELADSLDIEPVVSWMQGFWV